MCSSWAFHSDDRSESSSTYDMIIGNEQRSPWRIRYNHELQWPDGHLGYWHYSNERLRYVQFIISRGPDWGSYECKWTTNAQRWYSWATKILDDEYKPASLDDVIKTCENLHIEEQHQLTENITPKIWTSVWCNIREIQHGILNPLVSNWWILIVNQFMGVHTLFLDLTNRNWKRVRKFKIGGHWSPWRRLFLWMVFMLPNICNS
jgi:hypothetical protein